MRKLKVMFFGLGSIGSRHARLMKENFNHELYVYRHKKSPEKNSLGMKEIFSLRDIDKIKPDVAFITNPTYKHIEFAAFCAERGINLFIEKPLSNSKKGINHLLNIARKNNISAYVAYCLRFHPAIIWLKKHLGKNKPLHLTVNVSSYLPNWRKNINHLKHYSAFKSKGGGVILELSHEIDYMCYLLGSVKNFKVNAKKMGNVTVDSEDFADILLEFKSGVYCNLHLNFFSNLQRREIVADFKGHTVVGDLLANSITVIKDDKKKVIKFKSSRDDVLVSQMVYFFGNYGKGKMMNGLEEAARIFDAIIGIRKAAK